jgi:5'-methylthioadenosine phosphorylase
VFLAREAQMAYATVGLVTDYDCWLEDPAQHVSVSAVFELYGQSLAKARRLLDALLSGAPVVPEASIRTALTGALLTPDEAMSDAQRVWVSQLRS